MTVAICTRNRAGVLGEAIESVLRQLGQDTELLIVDNGSTDGTAALLQSLARAHPGVRVVCHPELGISHARNRALEEARGHLVLFVDDDATVRDGWLNAYRRFFRNLPSPRVAAAGGRIFPRYEGPVPVWISAKDNVLDRGDRVELFDARGAPWASNLAVVRATALECGGFDVALGRKGTSFMAAEETDLCCRLRQLGHEVWWLPEAEVDHRVPAKRVRIISILRVMFCLGRSSARLRLHLMPGLWRRLGFRAWRLLLTPPHLIFYLVGGLAVLVGGRMTLAARLFFRSARAAGFAFELAHNPK